MFQDEKFKVRIGKASFADDDSQETFRVRMDIEMNPEEFEKVHPAIGRIVKIMASVTAVAVAHVHCKLDVPIYDLTFAPNKTALRSPDHRTEIETVEFDDKVIIVRRVKKVENEKVITFHLLLRTSLTRTKVVRDFLDNSFGKPVWCRFLECQTEMGLEEGEEPEDEEIEE